MTFGDKFRAIRTHRVMDQTLEDTDGNPVEIKATRKQIRDRIRLFQLRNDGTPKETRPKVEA